MSKVSRRVAIERCDPLEVILLGESVFLERNAHVFPENRNVDERERGSFPLGAENIVELKHLVLVGLLVVLAEVVAVEVEEAVAQLVAREGLNPQVYLRLLVGLQRRDLVRQTAKQALQESLGPDSARVRLQPHLHLEFRVLEDQPPLQ